MTRFIGLDFQADRFHFGENRVAIERAEALALPEPVNRRV
jgi:hypothetical protein